MKVLVWTIGITATISILFYRSIWPCIFAPIVYWAVRRREKEKQRQLQEKLLLEQFMQGMQVLNTSLQTGFSMEHAWKDVEKEIRLLYGEDNYFYQKIRELNHAVELNHPIEKQFLKFAQDTGIEDILYFAELLDYGKRSGGNWRKIINSTLQRMKEKFEAEEEIRVVVAEKQIEQRVMNIIPLGILAFLQIFSWDYMEVLYHNPLGILCMSIVFIGYGGAMWLGEKILQIKV